MTRYLVQYGDYAEWFTCEADDATHAVEQTLDANPRARIHDVFRAEPENSWKTALYRRKEGQS